MEDAYVIKRTKTSGWFWISLFLFIFCFFQNSIIQEKDRYGNDMERAYNRVYNDLKKQLDRQSNTTQ